MERPNTSALTSAGPTRPVSRGHALPATALALVLVYAGPAFATDVDGPGDCARTFPTDFGDAPEGIPAYPGVLGRFPNCIGTAVAVGTVEGPCPPNFTVPGPADLVAWVGHVPIGIPSFWLGCYPATGGGIDTEYEGKVSTPAGGISACDGTQPTDCVETAFGMTFDQDECPGDGSDAGLSSPPFLAACQTSSFSFTTTNCGPAQQVYLNVLLDMNHDGDWLDSYDCRFYGIAGCVHEWAVQNVPITLGDAACEPHVTPAFPVGGEGGPGWLRVSISYIPAPFDFPWAGTQHLGQEHFPPFGRFNGGETEDYPVQIVAPPLPATKKSWGEVKVRYR